MRLYAIAVYLFLYIPIGIIVLFSFNAGRHASDFQGFSVKWYGKLTSNPFAMEALTTSLTVAFTTAVLASLFGTMAALALQRVQGRMRVLYDAVIYIAIMIPGIVIGIATLIALVTVFNALNPLLATLWPEGLGAAPRLRLGYGSLIAAHTLFTMALVIVIVRARIAGMDRALIEASADLYATPWGTFRQVTLPQIFPAILAGFLLSFTFSFDDFIIAFFVAGLGDDPCRYTSSRRSAGALRRRSTPSGRWFWARRSASSSSPSFCCVPAVTVPHQTGGASE